jgi:hypothetical protein
MIRNKIKVEFFLEDGCSQDEGEVSRHWQPINFSIYSTIFYELIEIAMDEWIEDHTIKKNIVHEVIFAHFIERDGAGAVTSEYFEPIYSERSVM